MSIIVVVNAGKKSEEKTRKESPGAGRVGDHYKY